MIYKLAGLPFHKLAAFAFTSSAVAYKKSQDSQPSYELHYDPTSDIYSQMELGNIREILEGYKPAWFYWNSFVAVLHQR